jgi:hypothetical protein
MFETMHIKLNLMRQVQEMILDSPQSNGVSERKNRTLTDLVSFMLDTTRLYKAWWGRLY